MYTIEKSPIYMSQIELSSKTSDTKYLMSISIKKEMLKIRFIFPNLDVLIFPSFIYSPDSKPNKTNIESNLTIGGLGFDGEESDAIFGFIKYLKT